MNLWDIGNIKSEIKNNNSDTQNSVNDKIINNKILNSDDIYNNKILDKNKTQDYQHSFDNYHEYFYIFSDDLDGWSE